MGRFIDSLQGNRNIWFIYIMLVIISIATMFSASSQLIPSSGDISSPILNHTKWLLLGFIAMLVTSRFNQKMLRKAAYIFGCMSFILLIVLLIKMHGSDSAAERNLSIGHFSLQPAEIARLTLFIICADTIERMHLSKTPQRMGIILMVIVDLFVLVIATSNLSTAILIMATCMVMMFLGSVNYKVMIVNTLFFVILGAAVLGIDRIVPDEGASRERLRTTVFRRAETWNNRIDRLFVDDTNETGTLIINDKNRQSTYSHIAIAKGGNGPHMPGSSTMRNYLSNVYNDYIFALIVEEMGSVISLVVIALYFFFAFLCAKIMRNSANIYQAVLVGGIGFIVLAQTLVHLFVCVSDFVTGQPLPLISQGGMSILVTSIYFGLILAASRRTERAKATGLELSENILSTNERRKKEKEFMQQMSAIAQREDEAEAQREAMQQQDSSEESTEKAPTDEENDTFNIEIISNTQNDGE